MITLEEILNRFFYCVDCDDWEPFSKSHLVRVIEPEGEPAEYELPHFQDNWSEDSLVKKSNGKFPARIIVNWKETDKASMSPRGRDRLSGYPRWVQDPEYPNCPICVRSMERLIFEFASDDNVPYLWGDAGT
jgi:hypothetical protein